MLDKYFKGCLYFTANRLSRIITKMAEESFSATGLSPQGAFLLMLLYEHECLTQKEIGQALHLQPSTVTRLVEKLAWKGFVSNRTEGRLSYVYATDKGREMEKLIRECWETLHRRYSDILGEKEGEELTLRLHDVSERLEY